MFFRIRYLSLLILILGLVGCSTTTITPSPEDIVAEITETDQQTDSPPPSATEPPLMAWFQAGFPSQLRETISPILQNNGYTISESAEEASLRFVISPEPGAGLSSQWVYTFAAPFSTVADGITSAAFTSYWQVGDPSGLVGFDAPPTLVLTTDSYNLLIALYGEPANTLPIKLVDEAALSSETWNTRPAISLLPFNALTPEWKVLSLDGLSVLDKNLDVNTYPLTIQVGVITDPQFGLDIILQIQGSGLWQETNRDPARMTVVTMTGVTALTRATAMQMELRGVDFPALKIMPFFADADILHTSNEVSFAPECPEPEWDGPPKFCSQRDYFALLENIGLDIVELTGNHNNDWGTAASINSINIYDKTGIIYYGGGRDIEDARAPRILIAPDGTRIAFVGCNSAGPFLAWATDVSAGAAPCEDWTGILGRITALKTNNEADLVIVTLQYRETPSYTATEEQIADFNALAAAGADIVSGSQAHQPQGFNISAETFIHYGVGNLFFDQMDYIENRQMFADKHILYEGWHISTVLFTGLLEDWAQPRPMTDEERAEFLKLIFESSGW